MLHLPAPSATKEGPRVAMEQKCTRLLRKLMCATFLAIELVAPDAATHGILLPPADGNGQLAWRFVGSRQSRRLLSRLRRRLLECQLSVLPDGAAKPPGVATRRRTVADTTHPTP